MRAHCHPEQGGGVWERNQHVGLVSVFFIVINTNKLQNHKKKIKGDKKRQIE